MLVLVRNLIDYIDIVPHCLDMDECELLFMQPCYVSAVKFQFLNSIVLAYCCFAMLETLN